VTPLSLEDLGNLGELIAAIATVATLVYLAQQIRRSAKSAQGSTIQSLMQLENSTFSLIARHADVYQRGSENIEDLTPEEEVVFEQLVSAVMSLMVCGFAQFQNGLVPDYDSYVADWRIVYLEKPGFQSAWARLRHSYPKDFCQYLDAIESTTVDAA
jgi:hypothetical protein